MTAEPYEIEKQGHFKPNVFLLSDYGYDTYSTLIVTRPEIVEKNPDLVQRFVDASAIGWYHYLYGDNSKANAMIKDEQPGHHRRADRLLDRRDEGERRRQFRRHAEARHRRDDRRALEGFLRQDGGDRHGRRERPTTRRPTRCSSSTRASGLIFALNDHEREIGNVPHLDHRRPRHCGGWLCCGRGSRGLGLAGFPATFSFSGRASPSTRRSRPAFWCSLVLSLILWLLSR